MAGKSQTGDIGCGRPSVSPGLGCLLSLRVRTVRPQKVAASRVAFQVLYTRCHAFGGVLGLCVCVCVFQTPARSTGEMGPRGLDFRCFESDNGFSYYRQSSLLSQNAGLVDVVFNCC